MRRLMCKNLSDILLFSHRNTLFNLILIQIFKCQSMLCAIPNYSIHMDGTMKKILLIMTIAFPLHAQIYKWTDEDGNIHFGDRPENPDTATEIDIKTDNNAGITNSSGNTKKREHVLKRIEKDKQAEEKRKKKQAEIDKKHRKLCKRYRSRLHVHLQTNRTYTMSPDGERTYYTDEQREQKKKRLINGVKKYCH